MEVHHQESQLWVVPHLSYHRHTNILVYVITISVGKELEKPTSQHFPSLILIKSYAYQFNPRMIKVNEKKMQFNSMNCGSVPDI